jgi:hypothetical protein
MIRVPYIKVLALTDDFLFATTDVAIWSTVEPGLGIVAAGAATLRPLFRTFYALSTRNKSSNHLTASKRSKLRNSHMLPHPQSKNSRIEMGRTGHSYKSSLGLPADSEEIQLRTDIGTPGTGMGSEKGGVVVSSNPFKDENEVDGQRAGNGSVRETRWGGIQVQRTVEVSRAERDRDRDVESISSVETGSLPNTPWTRPGTGRSDNDMV